MKARLIFVATLSLGLSSATLAASGTPPSARELGLTHLQSGVSTDCKPKGDGTFAEIVTTMASVLSPAEGARLLDRYCEPCMKQRFALSRP